MMERKILANNGLQETQKGGRENWLLCLKLVAARLPSPLKPLALRAQTAMSRRTTRLRQTAQRPLAGEPRG